MTIHFPLSALVPAAILAACGPAASPPSEPEPPAAAPPAAAQPAYVGRWAAGPDLCATGAWEFRHDGLSTAGEVSCRFEGVAALDDGYEIAAICTAQAPPEPHVLRLSFSAGGQAMTIHGGPFAAPPPLVRCGG